MRILFAASEGLPFSKTGGLADAGVLTQAQKRAPKAAMFASANGQATRAGMEFIARHGVFHCDANPPKSIPGVGWDYADAMQQQEFCAKYGVKIESYHIGVDQSIMLGKPEDHAALCGIPAFHM